MSTDVKPALTGRMWPVAPGDWHHAPDHLVAMVAALAGPPPRSPTGEPTVQQWYGQIRRVVDQVWSTAWLAGSADVIAQLPPPPIVFSGPPPPAVVAAATRTGQPAGVGPTRRTGRL